jgi:hypothetical protein
LKFQPEFDVVGVGCSLAAILILLFYGLTTPEFAQDLWVAFAFWIIGFTAALGLGITKRGSAFSFLGLFKISLVAGLIIIIFEGVNFAYFTLTPQELISGGQLVGFAIGVSEELFFGVFLLGILINYLQLHPIIAIIGSAAVHTFYHTPNWGMNPQLMMLFFSCFFIARTIYVFVFPKVGVILAAHGVWNFLVGG